MTFSDFLESVAKDFNLVSMKLVDKVDKIPEENIHISMRSDGRSPADCLRLTFKEWLADLKSRFENVVLPVAAKFESLDDEEAQKALKEILQSFGAGSVEDLKRSDFEDVFEKMVFKYNELAGNGRDKAAKDLSDFYHARIESFQQRILKMEGEMGADGALAGQIHKKAFAFKDDNERDIKPYPYKEYTIGKDGSKIESGANGTDALEQGGETSQAAAAGAASNPNSNAATQESAAAPAGGADSSQGGNSNDSGTLLFSEESYDPAKDNSGAEKSQGNYYEEVLKPSMLALIQLDADSGKETCLEIIHSYGVDNAKNIPKDKWQEVHDTVLKKIEEIEQREIAKALNEADFADDDSGKSKDADGESAKDEHEVDPFLKEMMNLKDGNYPSIDDGATLQFGDGDYDDSDKSVESKLLGGLKESIDNSDYGMGKGEAFDMSGLDLDALDSFGLGEDGGQFGEKPAKGKTKEELDREAYAQMSGELDGSSFSGVGLVDEDYCDRLLVPAIVKLTQMDHVDGQKEAWKIIKEYGVNDVHEIPREKWPEVYDKLMVKIDLMDDPDYVESLLDEEEAEIKLRKEEKARDAELAKEKAELQDKNMPGKEDFDALDLDMSAFDAPHDQELGGDSFMNLAQSTHTDTFEGEISGGFDADGSFHELVSEAPTANPGGEEAKPVEEAKAEEAPKPEDKPAENPAEPKLEEQPAEPAPEAKEEGAASEAPVEEAKPEPQDDPNDIGGRTVDISKEEFLELIKDKAKSKDFYNANIKPAVRKLASISPDGPQSVQDIISSFNAFNAMSVKKTNWLKFLDKVNDKIEEMG